MTARTCVVALGLASFRHRVAPGLPSSTNTMEQSSLGGVARRQQHGSEPLGSEPADHRSFVGQEGKALSDSHRAGLSLCLVIANTFQRHSSLPPFVCVCLLPPPNFWKVGAAWFCHDRPPILHHIASPLLLRSSFPDCLGIFDTHTQRPTLA
jgi:hypothetical protein